MKEEKKQKYKCPRCGCEGLHACIGFPIKWTEEDKEKLKKVFDKYDSKEKKNE